MWCALSKDLPAPTWGQIRWTLLQKGRSYDKFIYGFLFNTYKTGVQRDTQRELAIVTGAAKWTRRTASGQRTCNTRMHKEALKGHSKQHPKYSTHKPTVDGYCRMLTATARSLGLLPESFRKVLLQPVFRRSTRSMAHWMEESSSCHSIACNCHHWQFAIHMRASYAQLKNRFTTVMDLCWKWWCKLTQLLSSIVGCCI